MKHRGHQSLSLSCSTCRSLRQSPPPNLISMNFKLFQYINLQGRGGAWVGGGTLVLFQSESNICLHIYKWEIQEYNVSSHILHAHGSLLGDAAPPAADFCNSYLDEWLKLNHSQQESHHSYLRKNGEAVIFWCITQHLACKQDTPSLLMTPFSSVPPFL